MKPVSIELFRGARHIPAMKACTFAASYLRVVQVMNSIGRKQEGRGENARDAKDAGGVFLRE
jgi:hypothetical protein